MTIFPLFYAGNIDYYASLIQAKNPVFEIHENYPKQTYRNRCSIYGANGVLNLIIPVQHLGKRLQMKDVCISKTENWRVLHWRSLESAYRSSPYFEFYEYDIKPIYEKKHEYLIEFTGELHQIIMKLLKVNLQQEYTEEYNAVCETDFRNTFNAKKEINIEGLFQKYTQVFDSKHGFIPNLSIFDLLFNLGPESIRYLNRNLLKN